MADFHIPMEPSEPKRKIEDFLMFLYGPPKVGKSTFCSHFDQALFCATEPGLKWLRVRQVQVTKWEDFQDFVVSLEAKFAELDVRTVVVDTVDNLYKFCLDYVCQVKNMEHPSDQEWGKGWEAVSSEWHRWVVRLASIGCGVVFIGHSVDREVTYRAMKITKTVPAIPGTGYRTINALVDFIFYAGFKTVKAAGTGEIVERRILHTKPSESIEAGDRSGKLPATMSFAFDTFSQAFYGQTSASKGGKTLGRKG